MAFTKGKVWHRKGPLNEIIDAINARALILGGGGVFGWYPLAQVQSISDAVPTCVQRHSFWLALQQACEDLLAAADWMSNYRAGVALSTPADLDGEALAAVHLYTSVSDVFDEAGKTGGEYGWRRRMGPSEWATAGKIAGKTDVVSDHLVEDLQTFLESLVWTKHSITWSLWPLANVITGGGAGKDITKAVAITEAIAAYVTPGGATEPTTSYPHGIVGYALNGSWPNWPDPSYDGWASRSKNKGRISLVTGSQCDIYWLGYPHRWPSDDHDWSDQDSGAVSLLEKRWKCWEIESDVTPGATPRTSSTHFGDYDFANSPSDKPGTATEGLRRGWTVQSGYDCAAIDWRDSCAYY